MLYYSARQVGDPEAGLPFVLRCPPRASSQVAGAKHGAPCQWPLGVPRAPRALRAGRPCALPGCWLPCMVTQRALFVTGILCPPGPAGPSAGTGQRGHSSLPSCHKIYHSHGHTRSPLPRRLVPLHVSQQLSQAASTEGPQEVRPPGLGRELLDPPGPPVN